MRFVKGHGTENDFVLLPDLDDQLDLTAELVRAVCDRRAGLGADGVLRVISVDGQWFMDYRNADGSVAEMCGNGVRVFARYLVDTELVAPGEFAIGTRAGPRTVWAPESGDITVDMGVPRLLEASPIVAGRPGRAVSMGNPHVVVTLDDETELAALDLTRPPVVEPALPDGQNVEFIVRRADRGLSLRVHERGVGETRSCGTGICAAVVAVIQDGGSGRDEDWSVNVPGGELTVRWAGDSVLLTGPAMLVAGGEIDIDALSYGATGSGS
ncbi:MAG TPA: diaminopimelate epimerase [Mycobacteriales bacterium]|jgi:diaminopimelate epimerase|nr:diaminopimelate epimerase [Mycobacteriales bacterium]